MGQRLKIKIKKKKKNNAKGLKVRKISSGIAKKSKKK